MCELYQKFVTKMCVVQQKIVTKMCFFLRNSKKSSTFALDFTPKIVAIATKFEIKPYYGYTKKRLCRATLRQKLEW